MKVYISGPITNEPNYRKKFRRAALWLAVGGHEPVSPVDMLSGIHFDYEQYMAIDLAAVRQCDGVYMLKGWESSEGAKREKECADAYHIPVFYQ